MVLVAEDEESVRRLAVRILSDRDYRVLEAADGDEAWRRFREYSGEIDVLLTDVVMPGMPAKELVHEARALRPDLGAIYMSGYTGDMLSRRGVLDEGAVMIRKPFDAETLLAAVAGVGNGDR
jgi:two-component system cell cycle sensor histidine kinase/response regulator CckA